MPGGNIPANAEFSICRLPMAGQNTGNFVSKTHLQRIAKKSFLMLCIAADLYPVQVSLIT